MLLVGHGSRGWPDSTLLALAERLNSERLDVGVAVLRGRPTLYDALSTLAAEIVHVVPVFMADGRMAATLRSRLPADEHPRLILHPAVGGHPDMAGVVGGLIERVCAERAFRREQTAVVLAGHGNARHPAAAAAIHDLAHQLRADGLAPTEVHSVFLEQPPMVEDWATLTRRPSVLVVPCFLSAGAHARQDLPRRLGWAEGARGEARLEDRRVSLAPPLAMATAGLAAIVRGLISNFSDKRRGSGRGGEWSSRAPIKDISGRYGCRAAGFMIPPDTAAS